MATLQEALVVALSDGFGLGGQKVEVEFHPSGSAYVRINDRYLFEIEQSGVVTPPSDLDPNLATVISLDLTAAAIIWKEDNGLELDMHD
jgi:hypothetical protein